MHRTIHIVLTLLLILSAALPPGLQAQQKGFAVSGTVTDTEGEALVVLIHFMSTICRPTDFFVPQNEESRHGIHNMARYTTWGADTDCGRRRS